MKKYRKTTGKGLLDQKETYNAIQQPGLYIKKKANMKNKITALKVKTKPKHYTA